jgi:hypothetical protein
VLQHVDWAVVGSVVNRVAPCEGVNVFVFRRPVSLQGHAHRRR